MVRLQETLVSVGNMPEMLIERKQPDEENAYKSEKRESRPLLRFAQDIQEAKGKSSHPMHSMLWLEFYFVFHIILYVVFPSAPLDHSADHKES